MSTFIVVSLRYEAIHRWEDAHLIPEVSFLEHPHRHIFHIDLFKEVTHDNRQIEFIAFKREVERYISKYNHDFGTQSCEMIARELLEKFDCVQVSVKEDGENGSLVTK